MAFRPLSIPQVHFLQRVRGRCGSGESKLLFAEASCAAALPLPRGDELTKDSTILLGYKEIILEQTFQDFFRGR